MMAAVASVSSSPVIRPHPHAVIDKTMTPISTPPIKSPPTPPIAAVVAETDEKEEVMMPPPPLIMTNPKLGFVAPADEMMMIMSSSPSRSHFVGGLFGDPESQREPFFHLDYALKY